MAASVPERCPQCHSPVAERFPHAVMYDCGFSLFNDGQLVTDDYPAECQRRRIKRLEKQLAAARAEAERWRKKYEGAGRGVMADLTPDRLQELRRIAEAATPDPPTVLALLDEIERLRKERELLAAALNHVYTCEDCECASCPEGTGLFYRAYRALGGARDLLAGEKGGGGA